MRNYNLRRVVVIYFPNMFAHLKFRFFANLPYILEDHLYMTCTQHNMLIQGKELFDIPAMTISKIILIILYVRNHFYSTNFEFFVASTDQLYGTVKKEIV